MRQGHAPATPTVPTASSLRVLLDPPGASFLPWGRSWPELG